MQIRILHALSILWLENFPYLLHKLAGERANLRLIPTKWGLLAEQIWNFHGWFSFTASPKVSDCLQTSLSTGLGEIAYSAWSWPWRTKISIFYYIWVWLWTFLSLFPFNFILVVFVSTYIYFWIFFYHSMSKCRLETKFLNHMVLKFSL